MCVNKKDYYLKRLKPFRNKSGNIPRSFPYEILRLQQTLENLKPWSLDKKRWNQKNQIKDTMLLVDHCAGRGSQLIIETCFLPFSVLNHAINFYQPMYRIS